MSHFKAKRGKIAVVFTEAERVFLGDVLPFLASLGRNGEDPAATRLKVPVYLDNPDANDEWWRLMGDDLEAGRKADRAAFETLVSGDLTSLDLDQANAVLRVLNEARLALGARLGIDIEDDYDGLSEEGRQAMDYLGWIQEELIVELTKSL